LQSPAHIIATSGAKARLCLSEIVTAKWCLRKLDSKGGTWDGMDYELTIVFDIDIKHHASASKDRTGLFMINRRFIITEATGEIIRDWCMSGFKVSDIEEEINQCTTIDGLRHIFQKYPEYRKRIEPAIYRRKSQIEALAAVVNP
jgi:hypothetical protein